jgi:hypothetical protein
MDILISLDRYNKLSKSPDNAMVDSLARIANRITYKRFFDRRFKRIYQLDELDKGIQSMGLVDNQDMIYAANLSDIWDFVYDFQRGSGQRFEYGLLPIVQIFSEKMEENPNSPSYSGNPITDNQYNYGIYGFGSWNKFTPLSYQWQSDIMLDVTAGWQQNQSNNYGSIISNNYSALVNLSWAFGYYPTTRTYMSVIPYVRSSIKLPENEDVGLGVSTGMDFKSYFYISPRFRIDVSAGVTYGSDDFSYSTPTLFWNNSSTFKRKYYKDVITNPSLHNRPDARDSPNSSVIVFPQGFLYSGVVSFSYAIF